MQSGDLTEMVEKTVKSILKNRLPADYFGKPNIIVAAGQAVKSLKNVADIIVAYKAVKDPLSMEHNYWVLNCADGQVVSADTLRQFRDFLSRLPGPNAKGSVITCRHSFSREALQYAVNHRIGLARISPDMAAAAQAAVTDGNIHHVVHGTSPLELVKALCDGNYGLWRKRFYGISTGGKIEQLGSLENYIRCELVNFKVSRETGQTVCLH